MLLPIGENDLYKHDNLGVAWVSGITAESQSIAHTSGVCSGDLEEQTKKAYKNLELVLSRTGHTLKDITKIIYYIDPRAVPAFNQAIGVRAELFGIDQLPAVTAVAVHSLIDKGALVKIEAIADRNGKKTVHYPDHRNDWKLPYKPCWDGGNILWVAGLVARSYDSLGVPLWPSNLVGQTEAIYRRAEIMLSRAGLQFSDVVNLVDYVVPEGYKDYQQANQVRKKYFKDQPPACTTVVVDKLLADDALVETDMFAVRDGNRVDISLTSTSSISPDGVKKGSLVFTGGQVASDLSTKDTKVQATECLNSIGGLLEQAGGNKQNITRLVAYISEQAFGDYDEVLGAIEHYFSGSPPSVTAVAVQNLSDPNQNIMMNAVADLGTA